MLVNPREPESGTGISLGAYLKRERLRHGMTQRGVADALHMSASGYEKIENGQRIPHLSTLNALARLFEIPVNRRRVLWSIATGEDLGVTSGSTGTVSEGMLAFMRNLRGPAALQQVPEYNVLAANALAVRIFPWLDPRLGTPERPVNVIVQTMTDPRAPRILLNWDTVIHRSVFGLREYSLVRTPLERVREIREACRSHPDFDRIWNTPCPPEVLADNTAIVRDPDTGAISRFQMDSLRWAYPHHDMELLTMTPRDTDPADADPDTSTIVVC